MLGALLDRIETYYDLVPRANATAEDCGPFTVFVATGAWPFYARPRAGGVAPIGAGDVDSVVARLRERGVPLELEWVGELRPELAAAAAEAGLVVEERPLLALDAPLAVDAPDGIAVRVLGADDPALAEVRAAVGVGFRAGGTAVGAAGPVEPAAAREEQTSNGTAFVRGEITAGRVIMVGAVSADGAVGGGMASPRDGVAELTGIATVPSARRRGVGVSITAALVHATRAAGVELVFMSAASDDVARIYERAGFRRVATACVAAARA